LEYERGVDSQGFAIIRSKGETHGEHVRTKDAGVCEGLGRKWSTAGGFLQSPMKLKDLPQDVETLQKMILDYDKNIKEYQLTIKLKDEEINRLKDQLFGRKSNSSIWIDHSYLRRN
jgi:hypothetical protein